MKLWQRWRRDKAERDLDSELRGHMERLKADYMAAGMNEAAAGRRARIEFGGLAQAQEACRDVRRFRLFGDAASDLRYAFRTFVRNPTFSAVIVLTLGLGIGANTAIFTLMDAVMWRMLPVQDPQNLLAVVSARSGSVERGCTYKVWHTMQSRSTLAELAAYSPAPLSVSAKGVAEPSIEGQMVSGNYFALLGISPAAGRPIGSEDDRIPNGHPVAMISYGYWRRRFDLSPSAIGASITIAGAPFTIIGVTPSGFSGVEAGASPDIFVPLMMQPTVAPSLGGLTARNRPWCRLLARVKGGYGKPKATAELETIYRQETPTARIDISSLSGKARKWVAANIGDSHISMVSAAAGLSDLQTRFARPLFLLMAAVGVVLLIACANAANLLLARGAARRPEIAMRLALGAGRGRLVRQLVAESLALSALAGVAGIALASWGTRALVAYLSTGRAAVHLDLTPDLRVLSFAVAASIVTGLLFGLLPALRTTQIDLAGPVKSGGAILNARGGAKPGRFLAVAQVALTLVLLIGAGLFVRSLQNLTGRTESQSRENVLIVRVQPRGSMGTGDRRALDATYRELIQRVGEIRGVRSVSMAEVTPTVPGPGNFGAVRLASGEYSEPIGVFEIYPNYFAAAGIPFISGRDLRAPEVAENAPTACIVNETFVRQFYPAESPIGKPCEGGQIAGVVKDSRIMNPTGELEPMIYVAYLHSHTGRGEMNLYVRTGGAWSAILPRLKEEVWRIDRTVPQFAVRTLADEMDGALIRERLIATLSTLLAFLAAILAGVGVYGLLAFGVIQRTAEIGIRMALGATRGDVLWLVLRDAAVVGIAGVAMGIPAAIFAGRLAASRIPGLLFELTASDKATITGASALVFVVAIIAACAPARRAASVDPITALRND